MKKRALAVSTGEAARYCFVTSDTIVNWIKAGLIRAQRTAGGQYRILLRDLRDFMEERGMNTSLLPQSEANLDYTEAAYGTGTAGVIELIASQRALLEAHRGYVVAWADAASSLSDLERAVGLPLDRIESHGGQR